MIIDTSAMVAILLVEPESEKLVDAIASATTRLVGAPTLVEAAAVMLARKGPAGEIALDALIQRLEIDVVPMMPDAVTHARSAYRRFGKGVGSPGVLNFGDCLTYGVAMATEEQLLFVGRDFASTDVPAVSY